MNDAASDSAGGNVIIIGAGAAGISAALRLAEKGWRVILASVQPSARAQSVMAEGGINAALGEDDSPGLHAEETMRAGRYIADEAAVRGLTEAAPDIVMWLDRMGMSFKHDKEAERPMLRAFGGQSRKRTAFADASTGRQLMSTLIMLLRRYESEGDVKRLDHHRFVRLLYSSEDRKSACGAVFFNRLSKKYIKAEADAVIFACGGPNGIFGCATGSVTNDGSAAAALFADGVPFANGEFIQYHPTTVKISGKNMLITEAVRGEGGRLFTIKNGKRWYFMEELYPEQGNLAPRDVISREEWRLICDGYEIFLDMTCIDREVCLTRLQGVINDCREYFGVDPLKEPVRIQPGIHFFMGGISVDRSHRTRVRGLYAAGECACQYHGANRLGGNSLLAAIYGGMTAADSAAADMEQSGQSCRCDSASAVGAGACGAGAAAGCIQELQPELYEACGIRARSEADAAAGASRGSLASVRAELNRLMQRAMGLSRSEQELAAAAASLTEMEKKAAAMYDPDADPDEGEALVNVIMLARAMVMSALQRRESRGGHFRIDFPEESEEFMKRTEARVVNRENAYGADVLPDGACSADGSEAPRCVYVPADIRIYFEDVNANE